MIKTMTVLISFLLLAAPVAEAARHHRVRPAWRPKTTSIRVRVAPPSRVRVVVKKPARPGAGYVWRGGEWVWQARGWRWVPAAWVLPPSARMAWVPGTWRSGVWIGGYWR